MQWPISEIETLRVSKVGYPRTVLKGGSKLEVQGIKADQVSSLIIKIEHAFTTM